MRVLLVFLFWCNSSPSPPPSPPPRAPAPSPPAAPFPAAAPRCQDDWLLVRTVQNCGDIRGGYSGYWVLEVAEGPQRGSRVIAHYGDGAGVGMIGTGWHLAKSVQLGPTSPRGGWPNHCTQLGAVSYAGVVSELVAFDDEASARRALQAKRC